jgi:hypothetical protein
VASCLLVINAWLLIYLKGQLRFGKSLQATTLGSWEQKSDQRSEGSSSHQGRSDRRKDNLTRMLLGCVVLYFVTQVPAVTLNTLDHLSQAPYFLVQLHSKASWQPVVATLALVNYSVNFFVYMGMSAKFRRSAMQLFSREPRSRDTRGRGLTPASTTTRNSLVSSVSWTRDRARSHVTFLAEISPRSQATRSGREQLKQRSFSLIPVPSAGTASAESAETSFCWNEKTQKIRKSL